MEFDYSKLSGRIVEKFGNRRKFAEALGRQSGYVSTMLKGKAFFNQETIYLWAESLQIETEDIPEYFFKRKVCEE